MEVDPREVDKLFVKELNQLCANERERVMDMVHGVAASTTGTDDDVLNDALMHLQNELDKHYYNSVVVYPCDSVDSSCTNNYRSGSHEAGENSQGSASDDSPSGCSSSFGAYIKARSKNSSLLSDTQFRRGFLVAENFNPERAALRLMNYLEFIHELFETEDVLYRPIFVDDLHPKARKELIMGCYQMLPIRDSSGRRVFVYLRDICPHTVSYRHRSQVFVYFAQKQVEDPDGIVNVTFLHNSTLFTGAENNRTIYECTKRMMGCLPSRWAAIHLCLPDHPFKNLVKSAIILLIGKENRYRVQVHVGSPMECQYRLATYGIPISYLPVALTLNTTLRKDNISYHKKWLRMQKAKEMTIRKIYFGPYQKSSGSSLYSVTGYHECDVKIEVGDGSDNGNAIDKTAPCDTQEAAEMRADGIFRSPFVECPYQEDCLFGRGRNTMKHPGNVALRSMLDERQDQYMNAAHHMKAEIAWEVLNEIRAAGSRFLKELDNGLLVVVDDETARKKISIAFRDAKDRVCKRKRENFLNS